MEYTLKITMSPTVHEHTLAARVFITASDGNSGSQTAQIWECSVDSISVNDKMDPVVWSAHLLNQVSIMLTGAAFGTYVQGQENTMEELFEPKLFLRVGAGQLSAGRP